MNDSFYVKLARMKVTFLCTAFPRICHRCFCFLARSFRLEGIWKNNELKKNNWKFLPVTLMMFAGFCVLYLLVFFLFDKNEVNPPYRWMTYFNIYDVGLSNVTREELVNQLPIHKKKPILLFYNRPSWLDLKNRANLEACPYKCDFTDNRNRWNESEAVLFVASQQITVPKSKKTNGQIWIVFNLESPHTYSFGLKQWKNIINWTMTYRLDSDVFACNHEIQRKENVGYDRVNKWKPVSWLVSNCNVKSKRNEFTKMLKQYINVDVFGKCGKMKVNCKGYANNNCWRESFQKYFFYLSFENSFCRDYITEKAYNPLNNSIVPIVRGNAFYSKYLPLHSYINTADFKTVKSLSDYLKYLVENETEYHSYFEWRKHYITRLYNRMPSSFCELCRRLHFKDKYNRLYQNINEWWVTGSKCNDTITDLNR